MEDYLECPSCGEELFTEEYWDFEVYCVICDKTFEVEHEESYSEESGESIYRLVSGEIIEED